MTNPALKRTIFISLLGHLTFFSIFNLSFGKIKPSADHAAVFFWGPIFLSSQVNHPQPVFSLRPGVRQGIDLISLCKTTDFPTFSGDYIKPRLSSVFGTEKETFIDKAGPPIFSARSREQAIVFHPLLPYNFNLYFRDRQVAHVELAFNIISSGNRNSIVIKRKVSSGNLEVDLLSMRYIGYYLFIQQSRFSLNNWQVVKIDLSAKND